MGRLPLSKTPRRFGGVTNILGSVVWLWATPIRTTPFELIGVTNALTAYAMA